MSLELFKSEIDLLKRKIEESHSDIENEIFPIYDGAFNPEVYHNSNLKILWLMKEPYGDGDWSFTDFFLNDYERFYKELVMGIPTTWQPVVYISHGILEKFSCWDDMDYIRDSPEMAQSLANIAWINISKLPSKNGTKTNMNDIYEAYEKHHAIINEQIELLNPNIIICANTFNVIKDSIGSPVGNTFNSVAYYKVGSRFYIDVYHPAQRSIKRKDYVDDIILTIQSYLLKK